MLIWYYFLTYKSRSFLTINLSTLNLSVPYLYTDSPFLNFNTIKYWSLWLSASVKDRTSGKLECHLLLHGQPDWVFPSREVQVNLWMFQHGNFIVVTARFFDVAKFTTLTPLSLLLSRKFSFPALGWKNFLVPPFCIKMSQQNFQKVNRKKKLVLIPHTTCPGVITVFLSWACSYGTVVSHQWPLSTIYGILPVTNLTLLTGDIILYCTKILFLIDYFHFRSIEQLIILHS